MGQPQGEKNKNIESGSVISRKKSPWDGFADECNLLRKISRNHPDFAKLEKNLAERIIKLIHTPLPHEFHRNLTQIDEIKKSLMEVYSFLYSREERAKISTLETKFSSILSSMKPEEIIFIVLCFKLEYQMKKRYTCSDNALLYIPKIARLWQPELEKLSITDKQLDRIIEFIDLDNLRRQLVTKRKDPCSPLQYYRGAPLRTYRNSVVSSGQRSISGAAPVSPQQHTSASPREDRCSWGCRGTGWLPGGMRCPEHSGQLSGVIGNPLNSDTIPYCPKCGGSGRITQVIFPSENELISAAFNGQQLTAKQIRRTCPVCGGSGKRY